MAKRIVVSTLALIAGLASLSNAQPPALPPSVPGAPDAANPGPEYDPPGRAAQLSYVNGTVSFQPAGADDPSGGNGEWIPAPLNRPLTTGDRVWTEANGRAEMLLGSASLRLSGRTAFSFVNLDNEVTQIQVSSGTVSVRLRTLQPNESFEIDTPQAAFSLLRPGVYRVDVNEAGDATLLTVRGGDGDAVLAGAARVIPIHARTQVRITGAPGVEPMVDEHAIRVADAFDNFCDGRDRQEDQSQSVRYVSRDVPGVAQLDQYGDWSEDPAYGMVWAPRAVAVDWAPYHAGHWAWIAPWGWTWVDDAPWGYAPFHYGRWANLGPRWVWVPGPRAVRPVYAPALVAFVGGPRFSVSLSIGGGAAAVGWFPLAPGEVWVPAYRASPGYFNRVNVSNTVVNQNVNITNVYNNVYINRTTVNQTYVNQRVNGAVTAVPQSAMTSGRPVRQFAVPVSQTALASAQVQHVAPVVPQRAALFSGAAPNGNAGGGARPPMNFPNRAVVARTAPPPAAVPFSQQQQALQANPGQPIRRAPISIQRDGNLQRGNPQRYTQPVPNAGSQTPVSQPAVQPQPQNQSPNFGLDRSRAGGPSNGNPPPQANNPNTQPQFDRRGGQAGQAAGQAPNAGAAANGAQQPVPSRQTAPPLQAAPPAAQPSQRPSFERRETQQQPQQPSFRRDIPAQPQAPSIERREAPPRAPAADRPPPPPPTVNRSQAPPPAERGTPQQHKDDHADDHKH